MSGMRDYNSIVVRSAFIIPSENFCTTPLKLQLHVAHLVDFPSHLTTSLLRENRLIEIEFSLTPF